MRRRHRRLVLGALLVVVLPLGSACAGLREPAPPPPPSAPAPPPAEGRDLTSPVEDGEAEALEAEVRAAIRETEDLLDELEAETRRARAEVLERVRGLLDQSRAALEDGDLERAHNLSRKARDLAAEL